MISPRTISICLLATTALAPVAAAQQAPPREPGSLDKAFDALVGGAPDQQVLEPVIVAPRPVDPPVEPELNLRAPGLSPWRYLASPFGEQVGRVPLDDAGRVSVRRLGLGLHAELPGERGRLFGLNFKFESGAYEFDDATALVESSPIPIEDVVSGSLGFTWHGAQDREWSWIASGAVTAAAEVDAALEDSLTFGGYLQSTYRVDGDFGVTVGVHGTTRLEDDGYLFPVLGVDLRLGENTRLITRGPRFNLSHELNNGRSLFADIAYNDRNYRLDGLGPLPGGAFSDRDVSLRVGFDWRPGLEEWGPLQDSSASFYVGSSLWRELEFRLGDEEIAQTDLSSVFLVGVAVRLRF